MLIRDGVAVGGTTIVLGCTGWQQARPAWLAGMSVPDMQSLFSTMQQAYQQLSMGAKVISASYGQGDGTRSVTFSQANKPQLVAQMTELAQVLGIPVQRRRALSFWMR